MITIEPCCAATKHWPKVLATLDELGEESVVGIRGYGDMTLMELLPAMVSSYSEADVLVAVPTLPSCLREKLDALLHLSWGNDSGSVPAVARLRVITDARESRSPAAAEWIQDAGSRVSLASCQMNDTVVIIRGSGGGGVMVFGAVNARPATEWVAMATKDKRLIEDFWQALDVRFTEFKVC